MHTMEHCHIYSLDLPSLVADGSRTPQEACAHAFAEARKTPPSVVVLPQIDQWLPTADGLLVTTLTMLVQQLPPNMPLLLLGSTSQPFSKLSPGAKDAIGELFPYERLELHSPSAEERSKAVKKLAADVAAPPPPPPAPPPPTAVMQLKKAPPPKPRQQSAEEKAAVKESEEATLRNIRMELRDVCIALGSDKKYKLWSAPVDLSSEDGAAYVRKVGFPMELATILERVNSKHIITPSCFLAHLKRIVQCTEVFFRDRDEESMKTVSKAHELLDEGEELLEDIDDKIAEEAEALAIIRANRGWKQADPSKKISKGAVDPVAALAADKAAERAKQAGASARASKAPSDIEGDGEAATDEAYPAGETGETEQTPSVAGPSREGSAHGGNAWGKQPEGKKLSKKGSEKDLSALIKGLAVNKKEMDSFCEKATQRTKDWSVDAFSALMCDLYHELAGFQKNAVTGKLTPAEASKGLPAALNAALTLRANKVDRTGA